MGDLPRAPGFSRASSVPGHPLARLRQQRAKEDCGVLRMRGNAEVPNSAAWFVET